MKGVELYVRVRRAVFIEGMSRREAARLFGIDRRTVDKMLRYSVPPGYQRKKPPARPKLDPFVGIIDRILQEDGQQPKKQRHTSKRIFERLRDEHDFAGGITIVKDYVFAARQRQREWSLADLLKPESLSVSIGAMVSTFRSASEGNEHTRNTMRARVASVLHGAAGNFRNPLDSFGHALDRVANQVNRKRPRGGGLNI